MTGRPSSEMLPAMTTAQFLREECTVLEPGELGWDAAGDTARASITGVGRAYWNNPGAR